MRKAVFDRDGTLCALQLPGCTVTATTVDHIIPVVKGGPLLDPANGRPACGHCNSKRGDGTQTKRPAVPRPREEPAPDAVHASATRLDRAQPLGLPPSKEW
jgi:5-methylcytosine-specific restriction endonuclease McrA